MELTTAALALLEELANGANRRDCVFRERKDLLPRSNGVYGLSHTHTHYAHTHIHTQARCFLFLFFYRRQVTKLHTSTLSLFLLILVLLFPLPLLFCEFFVCTPVSDF